MNISYPLVLASASPARFQMLNDIGISCIQFPSRADEDIIEADPQLHTALLAERKMDHILHQHPAALRSPLLTADTVVSFSGTIIGKPDTYEQAREYLSMLSGSTHEVVTSFCLRLPGRDRTFQGTDVTKVTFHHLAPQDIEQYLASGEWMHAAGAYRVQKQGALLISALSGSFWNIAGLPIEKIFGIVRTQDCLHVVLGT